MGPTTHADLYLANELKEHAIKHGVWAGPVQKAVIVPVELAEMIAKVFLPRNPRKMRGADPAVVAGAIRFKEIASNGE